MGRPSYVVLVVLSEMIVHVHTTLGCSLVVQRLTTALFNELRDQLASL